MHDCTLSISSEFFPLFPLSLGSYFDSVQRFSTSSNATLDQLSEDLQTRHVSLEDRTCNEPVAELTNVIHVVNVALCATSSLVLFSVFPPWVMAVYSFLALFFILRSSLSISILHLSSH